MPYCLYVLTLREGQIEEMTAFLAPESSNASVCPGRSNRHGVLTLLKGRVQSLGELLRIRPPTAVSAGELRRRDAEALGES